MCAFFHFSQPGFSTCIFLSHRLDDGGGGDGGSGVDGCCSGDAVLPCLLCDVCKYYSITV